MMATSVCATLCLLVLCAAWLSRYVVSTRARRAEAFAIASIKAGAALLFVGYMLFSGRIGTPTTAESIATFVFYWGGATLTFLGFFGWATANDRAIGLANLTGETLIFVNQDGDALFTLHPHLGTPATRLPPARPGIYFIVSPALIQSEEAARRTDLRTVDTRSARRLAGSPMLLVRHLRARIDPTERDSPVATDTLDKAH